MNAIKGLSIAVFATLILFLTPGSAQAGRQYAEPAYCSTYGNNSGTISGTVIASNSSRE